MLTGRATWSVQLPLLLSPQWPAALFAPTVAPSTQITGTPPGQGNMGLVFQQALNPGLGLCSLLPRSTAAATLGTV